MREPLEVPGPAVAARDAPPATLPTFFIVGAMRSGTTALTRYLDAHPDVFMARPKEPHFLDRHFDRGLRWYARHFEGAECESAVGEATQTYLYEAVARRRLAGAFPGARLVALLRDPVERAYSHYWHERSRGKEPLSFADALIAEPDRLAAGDMRARAQYSYVDRGRYLHQLVDLSERFPPSAMLVMTFEELRDDPASAFARTCRFLGVDSGVRPAGLGAKVNAHTRFRSPALRRASRAWPPWLRRVVGRLNAEPAPYPPMDRGTHRRLRAVFEPERDELAARFGLDLTAWGA